jgi:hypothetical protein
MSTKAFALVAALAVAPAVAAQQRAANDLCRGDSWGDRESVCEVREYTVPATGATLAVDARPNGGIKVEGQARGDVHVLAKVVANADTKERAKQIASAIQIQATGDSISATGPQQTGDGEGWSVSYQLEVPEHSSLSLKSVNGGIGISHVDGQIEFSTTNGGVKLSAVGGDVRGRTTNGGVDVDLEGPTWQGEGLNVETMNGGVKLAMPADYSAHLQTGTVHGGVRSDFGTAMTAEGRPERNIDMQIGSGGALIHVKTTNGGISLRKK